MSRKRLNEAGSGIYFVTIRTAKGLHLFGEIVDGMMTCNPAGEMIHHWWQELKHKYPDIQLDAFIVMPNHMHCIIVLPEDTPLDLSTPLQWFKTMTTNAYIRGVKEQDWQRFDGKLWQGRYYDVRVRSADDLTRIRDYIQMNPARWHKK